MTRSIVKACAVRRHWKTLGERKWRSCECDWPHNSCREMFPRTAHDNGTSATAPSMPLKFIELARTSQNSTITAEIVVGPAGLEPATRSL